MEIKIRNSVVIKDDFLMAVQRLLQSRSMPAKLCIEINRIIDEVVSHIDILRKSRRDVALRYCNKDKDGNAVVDANNKIVFPDDASEKACRKGLDELDKEFFTAELSEPVVIYEDENITPVDLRLLGQMVVVKERSTVQGS